MTAEQLAVVLNEWVQVHTSRELDQSKYLDHLAEADRLLMEFRRSVSAMDTKKKTVAIFEMKRFFNTIIEPFFDVVFYKYSAQLIAKPEAPRAIKIILKKRSRYA